MTEQQEFLDKLKDPIGMEIKKGLSKFKDKLISHQFDYTCDYQNGAYRILISSDDRDALGRADEYFQYCFQKISKHCLIVKQQRSDLFGRSYYVSRNELSSGTVSTFNTTSSSAGYFYCPYVPE